jgi:hypothetical protein
LTKKKSFINKKKGISVGHYHNKNDSGVYLGVTTRSCALLRPKNFAVKQVSRFKLCLNYRVLFLTSLEQFLSRDKQYKLEGEKFKISIKKWAQSYCFIANVNTTSYTCGLIEHE